MDAPIEDALRVTDRRFEITPLDVNDSPYLNRELSWLAFNARVLALAGDDELPLLERVKFLAIYASNLDEFFQVRVGALQDQVAADIHKLTPDGRTPLDQLHGIRRAVLTLERHRRQIFEGQILPELERAGISIVAYAELDDAARKVADEFFTDHVFPVLTPLAVDPGHPFPYSSDLSLNIGVRVRRRDDQRSHFARVKIPASIDRFIALDDHFTFLPLEDLIIAHLDTLFPGLAVAEHLVFRLTRNADLNYREEEADDLLENIEMELRRRRLGDPARLQIRTAAGGTITSFLVRELGLDPDEVYVQSTMLAMVDLWALAGIDLPELQNPSFTPVVPRRLARRADEDIDLFEEIRARDLVLHHPYDSFSATIQDLVAEAADDPDVVAIKMTLYRTSSDSPIVRSLVRAVESGKQVAVLIELKARFDEHANIEWARTLEQAGVHVTYGLPGLKIHAKLTMIVRREGGRMVRYCHYGTGNYNRGTAKLYGDVGVLTASETLGDEIATLFNTLTGYGENVRYDGMLTAPDTLRSGLEELVRGEMEADRGRIIIKVNSLVDPGMIDLLYEASQAGVHIDLIVRGICGLRPGIPGRSDTITVRSIIGRYLEHARIYYFENGRGPLEPIIYIGSADLMPRNLVHRVETLVAVTDPNIENRLRHVLDVNLAPSSQTWLLASDGTWTRDASPELLDIHETLERDAIRRRSPEHPAISA